MPIATPYFEISFGSRTLTPQESALVTSVEIKDEAEEKDTASLVVNDSHFRFQGMVSKGLSVRIVAGFFGGDAKEFIGEISGLKPEYPESGLPTLTIECSSRAKKGHEGQVNKAWRNVKRSDIAKRIAEKHGWAPVVDETREIVEQETQAGESDVDFLRRLARKENFTFRVKGNVALFKKAPQFDELSPVAAFDYRIGNHLIKSFSPRYASDETGKDVEASTVGGKSKEVVTGRRVKSAAKAQGKEESGKANRSASETVYPSEKDSFREAQPSWR